MSLLRRLHRDERAAMAIDFTLILLVVVFPIGLMVPRMLLTIQAYSHRVIEMIRLPFP